METLVIRLVVTFIAMVLTRYKFNNIWAIIPHVISFGYVLSEVESFYVVPVEYIYAMTLGFVLTSLVMRDILALSLSIAVLYPLIKTLSDRPHADCFHYEELVSFINTGDVVVIPQLDIVNKNEHQWLTDFMSIVVCSVVKYGLDVHVVVPDHLKSYILDWGDGNVIFDASKKIVVESDTDCDIMDTDIDMELLYYFITKKKLRINVAEIEPYEMRVKIYETLFWYTHATESNKNGDNHMFYNGYRKFLAMNCKNTNSPGLQHKFN